MSDLSLDHVFIITACQPPLVIGLQNYPVFFLIEIISLRRNNLVSILSLVIVLLEQSFGEQKECID